MNSLGLTPEKIVEMHAANIRYRDYMINEVCAPQSKTFLEEIHEKHTKLIDALSTMSDDEIAKLRPGLVDTLMDTSRPVPQPRWTDEQLAAMSETEKRALLPKLLKELKDAMTEDGAVISQPFKQLEDTLNKAGFATVEDTGI